MLGNELWSFGLIRDMEKASEHVIRNDLAVVIRDKYPKARYHFLVLPWADIDTVYQLTREDIPLLEEMYAIGTKAIIQSRGELKNFKVGFHMKPSMHRLHLHVISKDFISDRLKPKHWNLFHTDLFMPFQNIIDELLKQGNIKRRPDDYISQLLNAPLACHRCNSKFTTFPSLKAHLANHGFIS